MMKRRMLGGTVMAALAMLAPMAAQAMTVADFLAKVQALKARGVLALGSPDIAVLKAEIEQAATAYRANLAREKAAGKKPSSCPPPKGSVKLSSDQLVADFSMIPPAQRGQSVTTAFAAAMTKRYPCPPAVTAISAR